MNWSIILQALGVLKGVKWYWIVIIFLLCVILIQRCYRQVETVETVTVDTVTVVKTDTITYEKEIYKPYPVYETIVHDSFIYVPADVDTAFILKDYFSHNFYRDTILDDSNGFIVISDVIHKNRVESRSKELKLYDRTVYIHLIDEAKKRNKLYVGFGIGYGWKYNEPVFSGNVMLVNKKDNAYQLDYDVFNNAVRFSTYWKIRLKNR